MTRRKFKDRAEALFVLANRREWSSERRAAKRLAAKAKASTERAVRKSKAELRIPNLGVQRDKGWKNVEYLRKQKQVA